MDTVTVIKEKQYENIDKDFRFKERLARKCSAIFIQKFTDESAFTKDGIMDTLKLFTDILKCF